MKMKGQNQLIINNEELKDTLEYYLNSELFFHSYHKVKVLSVKVNRRNTRCTITFTGEREDDKWNDEA